ncbi:nucleotide disphospho-sugar-binding domain-containing protein [Micromonospora carbonacea]|uniref:nucleotide disphospho-sugar-binding domain-containing protein n=1 Tax=Micromonospora carbonacea TaxID=47853 RepID=UPI003D733B13
MATQRHCAAPVGDDPGPAAVHAGRVAPPSTCWEADAGGGLMRAVPAAGRVDAEFVLTRPGLRRVRHPPATVGAVGWIPLAAALPASAAPVYHGGSGSACGAFVAGIPPLATTGPGDRRHNAGLIAARGAGLAAPARRITAGLLTRLLTDPAPAGAAREVSGGTAAMPAPADPAPRLETLR